MELARLASSKQASPAGPFSGPKATGVPKSKKMLPRYPGWFPAPFSGTTFFSVGPPPVGNGDSVVFWPVLALGTWKNSRRKTRKCHFPVLGALLWGKSGRPTSFSPKLRNLFILSVLAEKRPTCGKSQNTGGLGHFGLG